MPDWLQDGPEGCLVHVRVVPRAGRSTLAGERAGTLLVRLAAAPVDGAANDALAALLSARLGVPRRAVRLVAGARARDKRLLVRGLSAAEAARRLEA